MNRFLIITEQTDGPAMWKMSNLVIRATNTDGNSISIREYQPQNVDFSLPNLYKYLDKTQNQSNII